MDGRAAPGLPEAIVGMVPIGERANPGWLRARPAADADCMLSPTMAARA